MSTATETRLPATVAGASVPAFGTTLSFWVTDARQLGCVALVARSWIEAVDAACSRFRDGSDLGRANSGAGEAVTVSPVLLDAVEAACEMARLTGGLYDPTVGRAVIAAGYDQSFDSLPRVRDWSRGRAVPAGRWAAILIDRSASTITVPKGVSLDLGGSAKGWTVDTALDLCRLELGHEASSVGLCMSAGGDIAVAGPPPLGGWPVRLSETLDRERGPGDEWVALQSGAIATSGALHRRWTMRDGEAHHIIDPRTGAPGQSCWRLVTVMAGRCLVADTAATAAWLLGDEAPRWMASIGVQGRLVASDGTVTRVCLPPVF